MQWRLRAQHCQLPLSWDTFSSAVRAGWYQFQEHVAALLLHLHNYRPCLSCVSRQRSALSPVTLAVRCAPTSEFKFLVALFSSFVFGLSRTAHLVACSRKIGSRIVSIIEDWDKASSLKAYHDVPSPMRIVLLRYWAVYLAWYSRICLDGSVPGKHTSWSLEHMKPSLLSFKTRCFSKIGIIFCKTNALSQSKVQCSFILLNKTKQIDTSKT